MTKRLVLNQDNRVGDWVCDRVDSVWVPGRGVGIGLEESGQLIAGVMFDSFNHASVCMHVAAEPGKRWMTREYLWMCFAVPFLDWKVKKIIGTVGSGNLPARQFDENLGFVLEATLKDAHPDGDLLLYTMRREQCRWLDIKLRKNHVETEGSPGT